MRLLTFKQAGEFILGVKLDTGIVNTKILAEVFPGKNIATTMEDLLAVGDVGLKELDEAISGLSPSDLEEFLLEEGEISYAPAITNPEKIICVGLNYRKHADETKAAYPEVPVLFNKFNNALTGHLAEIPIPRTTERLDHEVELGIIIGKEAKYVSEEDALDYVFGYCTTNDLSARDLQKRSSQWLTGKSSDGFAPVGPYIVTKDEVADPDNLRLQTIVNGEVRQDSTTQDMIFNCAEIISYISQHMTLVPGDLIMTGTPEGVIIGRPMAERVYLLPGDEVTVEVEGLGALTNYFVKESAV